MPRFFDEIVSNHDESSSPVDCYSSADFLPFDGLWIGWEKWATSSDLPSVGLRTHVQTGSIQCYPELLNLIDVQQDPAWHPEGCVWTHTLHVCDAAALICNRDAISGEDRVALVLAALCHDLGKAMPEHGGTTVFGDGRWQSPKHAKAGVPLTHRFLARIGCPERIAMRIAPLVAEHMFDIECDRVSEKTVRKLSSRLGNATIAQLLLLIEADHMGRPPLPLALPLWSSLAREIDHRLKTVEATPTPFINGKHLLALGIKPGPVFRRLIAAVYAAQLDQQFQDEADALEYLNTLLDAGSDRCEVGSHTVNLTSTTEFARQSDHNSARNR